MSDINLLPKTTRNLVRQKKFARFFRLGAVLCLCLVIILSIVLFVLKLQSPLPDLKKEENELLTNLNRSNKKITMYLTVNDRLSAVGTIFSERPTLDKTIDKFMATREDSVSISSVQISKNKINFSGNGESLDDLNTFFDNLVQTVTDKKLFKKVTLNNFSLDKKNGKFVFNIDGILL